MRPGTLVILAGIALGGGIRQPPLPDSSGDLVELDVLALDKDDRPVHGLQLSDFEVREDGRPVELKTFSGPETKRDEEPTEREVVLLLDDSSVPMVGTAVIQNLARAILSRGTVRDEVTVVRLNNDRDEPYGDLETALSRIDGYRAGAVPFQNRGTADRLLRVIGSIARQMDASDHRRKLIVCIGGPRVCNVLEPPRGYGLLWRPWVDALASASRANAAVYAVMPISIEVPLMMAGGLVEMTGGDVFVNTSKFERFVDRLWMEARDYYLLGYWPSTGNREMHSVAVKIRRKGVRVRARRVRG